MIPFHVIYEAAYDALYLQHFDVACMRNPAPNSMFDYTSNITFKFMRPANNMHKWSCPVCGKKRGNRWFITMLAPFQAPAINGFTLNNTTDYLPALTPVCGDHPLAPWYQEDSILHTTFPLSIPH